jgi:hypothetical protein
MNPQTLEKDLYETERMAIRAMPYIPKGSFYRTWSYRLLAGDIEVWKYLKLKRRLHKFHSQS